MKKLVLVFLFLAIFADAAIAQRRSTDELEKARLVAKEREENLTKVRDVLKAKIDKMQARLDERQRQLEAVNTHIDHTRQMILETEKAIQDRVNNKVW